MTTTLLVMTLNEIDGMKAIMPQIQKSWVDQIIVVDGGSKDGTIEYAKEHGYEVVMQTRPGTRMAYIECYDHINGDIVIAFSPDGNSIVETIPELIQKMEDGYDMVIASRYKEGAKSYDDTKITGIANYIFSAMISLFGYHYTDAMVMFRAFRKEVPEKLKLNVLRNEFYEKYIGRHVGWEPLMSIRAAKMKMKIAEIPSDEPERIDEDHKGYILPKSRISHFKSGFVCLFQVFEEFVFWSIKEEPFNKK